MAAVPPALEKGWFVEPTLFADVDNDMTIAQEEIFGPVLSVIPYDDAADAVRIANDSDYGLSGSVWTTDVEAGIDVARQVRTGTYGVNAFGMSTSRPFGGFKASGVGRELGPEGLDGLPRDQDDRPAGRLHAAGRLTRRAQGLTAPHGRAEHGPVRPRRRPRLRPGHLVATLLAAVALALLAPAAAHAASGQEGGPGTTEDATTDVTPVPNQRAIPLPNSGHEPTDAGDPGGIGQVLVFVGIVAALATIALLVRRDMRRAAATRAGQSGP